ncbi:hypothetical protein [Bacillus wiedmannii]
MKKQLDGDRLMGYYDGTRKNDAATRAEVVTMLYNAFHNNSALNR